MGGAISTIFDVARHDSRKSSPSLHAAHEAEVSKENTPELRSHLQATDLKNGGDTFDDIPKNLADINDGLLRLLDLLLV